MKMFPSPRIPTGKIPESRPHIERGEHTKLYRFSEEDFQEVAAVWNGTHPETGDELVVANVPHPEGVPAHDLPPQPAVFAPGYSLQEIAEIAQKLRRQAGLPDKPTGVVSEESQGARRGLRRPGPVVSRTPDSTTRAGARGAAARAVPVRKANDKERA